ncbi:MAG: YegS/Rv2252/BmrU family lipid kinase [Bacteroidetes bacterium]|nr:YegS/Rv2252/BmrU family lipid kinase [Bacteroidota bacterium]
MQRKIIYLINPISGTQGKSSLKELIGRKTKEQGIEFDILHTNAEGNYHFLKSKIKKERITDVVICGGDGTVSAVAAALTGEEINIGIIPMGSGNGLAFAAKIPSQPTKALDIIFKGTASFVDGFYINDQFSCMLCGIGFDAAVAHDFAKQKRRGLQTYIKVSAINFFKAKAYPFEITSEKNTFHTDAFFISIANSNQFGNNFTIAPQASLSDGLLDIVIVKKMSRFMLPFSILGQVAGVNSLQDINDYASKKNIFYFQTKELTINNPQQAPVHIDGDPKNSAVSFSIRVVPKAIRLIQP